MKFLIGEFSQLIQRHPKRWMGGLGALLLGTGVTAFGVAPLSAEIDRLPTRELIETIDSPLAASTTDLAATAPFVLFRSDVTRRDDSLQSLLQRLGVQDSEAVQFLRSHSATADLLRGPAGKLVTVETDENLHLRKLTARWLPSEDSTQFSQIQVERNDSGWTAQKSTANLTASVRLASGTIKSSLFAATDAARLPDSIASQLADIFSGSIDFRRELRAGDRFSVVYEALESDGEVLKYGRLLSAEFVNDGKVHQVVWFQQPGEKGAYYNFKGESTRRAFLASPLAFSRVSSGYGMRFHPVSGDRKAHLGVDYAAPTGTPVRSVGDGLVESAGWQRGYGNMIVIRHNQGKTTGYAHLSRINVRKGQRIEQGQLIGLVGSTGVSTGPHLHFEYRVGGQHVDPFAIARQSETQTLSAKARPAFEQVARAMLPKLQAAATVVQASAD